MCDSFLPCFSYFHLGGISSISLHTFSVARYFFKSLRALHHGNGRALAEVYCQDDFEDPDTQGAIVTFNLLRANGDYTGFSEVNIFLAAYLKSYHLKGLLLLNSSPALLID